MYPRLSITILISFEAGVVTSQWSTRTQLVCCSVLLGAPFVSVAFAVSRSLNPLCLRALPPLWSNSCLLFLYSFNLVLFLNWFLSFDIYIGYGQFFFGCKSFFEFILFLWNSMLNTFVLQEENSVWSSTYWIYSPWKLSWSYKELDFTSGCFDFLQYGLILLWNCFIQNLNTALVAY